MGVFVLGPPSHKMGFPDKGPLPLLLQQTTRLLCSRLEENIAVPLALHEWKLWGHGDAMNSPRKMRLSMMTVMTIGMGPAVLVCRIAAGAAIAIASLTRSAKPYTPM